MFIICEKYFDCWEFPQNRHYNLISVKWTCKENLLSHLQTRLRFVVKLFKFELNFLHQKIDSKQKSVVLNKLTDSL